MANKKYEVISDFFDEKAGKVLHTGAVFEADEDRANRAREAGVIGKEVKKEASKPQNEGEE